MLMSNKGTVLRCDVNGKIVMKVFLSGMPDVKLGLNDKLEVCAALGSGLMLGLRAAMSAVRPLICCWACWI